MARSIIAVKGLEMPTGDKRCELSTGGANCNWMCKPSCRCDRWCVVTKKDCRGLEHDKADDCPMFELELREDLISSRQPLFSELNPVVGYVEVKP